MEKYKVMLSQNNKHLLESQDIIKWRQWQEISYEKEGEKKSKIGDDIKTGTMKNLLDHYINQLHDMSVHQFCKIWQLKQFNRCVRNLKPGQVLFVHDFSQNLLLYLQDEPQSRYWVHKQITIHPTVVYYKCLRNGCEEIVKEDLIHITEDLSHDQDAVQAFLEASVQHLKQKGVEIKEIIQFSDHAASQYKSKTVFYKLSKYDIPVTNHFFAVRHGKGPANRAGGNFKVFILNTIKIGTVHLSTLEEIAEYCSLKFDKQVACIAEKISHSLKKVFLHKEITRDKTLPKLKRVIDTRKLHSIRNTGHEGVLEKKEISCLCSPCFHHSGSCENPSYLDEWKMVSITHHKKKDLQRLENIMHKKDEKVTEIPESPENTLKTDMDAKYIMKSHEKTSLKETDDVGHATKLKQPMVPPVMPNVIVQEDFHNKNWRAILLEWSSAGYYEELKNIVTRENFLPISPGVHHEMQPEDTIDWVTMNFFPDDGPKNALPVSTYGDGHCFPRAISKILFGTEQHHCEIRARIVKEGIENETELTTDGALTRG